MSRYCQFCFINKLFYFIYCQYISLIKIWFIWLMNLCYSDTFAMIAYSKMRAYSEMNLFTLIIWFINVKSSERFLIGAYAFHRMWIIVVFWIRFPNVFATVLLVLFFNKFRCVTIREIDIQWREITIRENRQKPIGLIKRFV